MSFPKQITIKSAVPGVTAATRKVLDSVTAGSATTPTLATDGVLLNRNEYIHILYTIVDASDPDTTFYVQLWWYSQISGSWHKGERMSVNANDVATIEVQGLSRAYLQVDSKVDGSSESGTPALNAWIGLVVPV